MNPVLDSGEVVPAWVRVVRDSAVASGVRSALRPFRRIDEAFARAAADKEALMARERVGALVRDSAILRAADVLWSAPQAAWPQARVRPFADRVRATIAAMPLPRRIRLLGAMLAVALVTRSALGVLGGAPLTAPTLQVWGTVLASAIVMMSAPRQVAAGWHERRRRSRR